MIKLMLVTFFLASNISAAPLVLPSKICPEKPLYTPVDFFPLDVARTMEEAQNSQAAINATFKFFSRINSKEVLRCGAFHTSKQGHFVSAAHCFNPCLERTGYLKKSGKGFVRTEKKLPATCKIEMNKKEVIIKVHSMGSCLNYEDPKCDSSQDFLIAQIEGVHTSCVAIRKQQPPILGEELVAVGFPDETMGRLNNSDGKHMHLSFGEVLENGDGKCTYVTVDKLAGRVEKSEAQGLVPNPGLQRMSADFYKGSSGGPIVDRAGHVVGVGVLISGPEDTFADGKKVMDYQCDGSTHFNPITSILKHASAQLSAAQLDQTFNCK